MDSPETSRMIEQIGPEVTKQSIREKVWAHIEERDLANFPRPVQNRIPNFKGAEKAGRNVSNLPEFSAAKIIKVNPDKPQEEVRYQALLQRKELLVPTPRLKSGLFNRLVNPGNASQTELRILASRQGIDTHSKPVSIETKLSIDVVVIGSVAVDRLGHRIGKGEGYADLEFALAASHHRAVNQDTIVVTSVHDCQVFENLPAHLFSPHDVPVDIIVTPNEVFRIENRLTKPTKIMWNLLTKEKINQISLLKAIRKSERSAGVDVSLFDKTKVETKQSLETSDKDPSLVESESDRKEPKEQQSGLYFSGIPKNIRVSEFKEALRDTGAKLVFVRWKAFKQAAVVYFEGRSEDLLNDFSGFEINGKILQIEELKTREKGVITQEKSPKETSNRSKKEIKKINKEIKEGKLKKKKGLENQSGIFFGQIPRKSKKGDLLNALKERDANPSVLEWYGRKGFAFAFWYGDNQGVFERVTDLTIGDTKLNVELYKKPLEENDTAKTTKVAIEEHCKLSKVQQENVEEKNIDLTLGDKIFEYSGNQEEEEDKSEGNFADPECEEKNQGKSSNEPDMEKDPLNNMVVSHEDTFVNEGNKEMEDGKEGNNTELEISKESADNGDEILLQGTTIGSGNFSNEEIVKPQGGIDSISMISQVEDDKDETCKAREELKLYEKDFLPKISNSENTIDEEQVPAANCCDIIRDLQEVTVDPSQYEKELERNGVQKPLNFNETSFTVLRSSMSKLSIASNSSQNILKEKMNAMELTKDSSHKKSGETSFINKTSMEQDDIEGNVAVPKKKKQNDIARNTDISTISSRTEAQNFSKSHSNNLDTEQKKEKAVKKDVNLKKANIEKSDDKKEGKTRDVNRRENPHKEEKIDVKVAHHNVRSTHEPSGEKQKKTARQTEGGKSNESDKNSKREKSKTKVTEGESADKNNTKPNTLEQKQQIDIKHTEKSTSRTNTKKNETKPSTNANEPNKDNTDMKQRTKSSSRLNEKSTEISGSSESKPPTTSKPREKSNGRQIEKEKSQRTENKPSTPGPIKKSKSIANNIEKPPLDSSTKSAGKQVSGNNEQKEKNKMVSKGETPVNKNDKDGCVIG